MVRDVDYFNFHSAFDEEWYRSRWQKADEEIGAKQDTPRFRALAVDESLIDAITSAKMPLVALRALACTCTAYRAKILALYKLPEPFVLRPIDCTESNAAFVAGPLVREINPDVWLSFVTVRGVCEIKMKLGSWMRHQEHDTRGVFGDTTTYHEMFPRKSASWGWSEEMGTTLQQLVRS